MSASELSSLSLSGNKIQWSAIIWSYLSEEKKEKGLAFSAVTESEETSNTQQLKINGEVWINKEI